MYLQMRGMGDADVIEGPNKAHDSISEFGENYDTVHSLGTAMTGLRQLSKYEASTAILQCAAPCSFLSSYTLYRTLKTATGADRIKHIHALFTVFGFDLDESSDAATVMSPIVCGNARSMRSL